MQGSDHFGILFGNNELVIRVAVDLFESRKIGFWKWVYELFALASKVIFGKQSNNSWHIRARGVSKDRFVFG